MEERYGRFGRPVSYVFLTSVLVCVVAAAAVAVLTATTLFVSLLGQDTPLWGILGGVTIVMLFILLGASFFIIFCYGVGIILKVGIDGSQRSKLRVREEKVEAKRQRLLTLPKLPDESRKALEGLAPDEPDDVGMLRRFWLSLPRYGRKE